MNCLFVKAPFAGWIADGVKLIEYRTRETLIRGRIGIIENGTGTVIGDAELIDCNWNPQQRLYLWLLRNPRRYVTPVLFEHKQGRVTWAILDIDPEQQAIAPRLTGARFKRESAEYRKTLDSWLLEHAKHLVENAAQAAGISIRTEEAGTPCEPTERQRTGEAER